jgi:hypothetical protein
MRSPVRSQGPSDYLGFCLDLFIYLSVIFLVRELYFPQIEFIANGLFWSFTGLLVAVWRMNVRGVTWADLGLRRPESAASVAVATVAILVLAIGSIVVFEVMKDQIAPGLAADTSNEAAVTRFGGLQGNLMLFLMIIPFVWLESMLEEMLDRGFLMNWIERTLPSSLVATVFAVVAQAAIFGFRHSYDLSERSVTVGLIGLAMGVGYVVFGRNLWPLIIAHCVLNTVSMLDRVA